MIAFRVISGVTTHFLLRMPEWANAITMLLFGQLLLERGATFDQAQFVIMADFASEDVWGWALVAIGSIRLVALVLNGTFAWFAPWSVRLRALSATLCCFGWFCISLGLYLSGVPSPGWRTYAVHLVVDTILAIHLAGQAGKVDRGMWNGNGTA